MKNDTSIRFSDEAYYTKDEVKKTYNMASIDSIWDKVLDYRQTFTNIMDIQTIEHQDVYFVLVPTLATRITNFERRLFKAFFKFNRLNDSSKKEFTKRQLINNLHSFNKLNDIEMSDEMENHLILNDLSTLPPQYLGAHHYLTTERHLIHHLSNPFDYSFWKDIYNRLVGIDDDSNDSIYRKTELENLKLHFECNMHYDAAPTDRIEGLMDQLANFLKTATFSPLIKSIVAYTYILYVKPFEILNLEVATLTFKAVLGSCDFDVSAFFLNIEDLMIEYKHKYSDVEKEVQKTNDFTYFVPLFLSLLEKKLSETLDEIAKLEIKDVSEELGPSDEEVHEIIKDKEIIPLFDSSPSLSHEFYQGGISFKQDVAMPIFPTGLDEEAVETIADNLVEVYPILKKSQALFYANHCTIGKHYTISQYKAATGCAYETARTSMDLLTEYHFYDKKKVRNKFVYAPIPRRN